MPREFLLPEAPPDQTAAVKAWPAPVVIPTYAPLPADKNPMFLEKRVYQGSSGRVYPLPFIDRISEHPADHTWQAVHLENEYLRVMILPELGGRIHVGLDKTNGYDFFYRQNVIKPALVGLAGPWISGGVEFNWPQHHRPSTFMPTEVEIEKHPDGSVTVWCGEHEPMHRMKGMHGVCLHPGKAIIELKVRLYNRTCLIQTFLWWANVAARVHERYQSFFPPDVRYVADHARRAMSRFPLCEGQYYGVDYAWRATRESAATSSNDDATVKFAPPQGMYAPNDLSWYGNIPVPTSYMIVGTSEAFFGGYDHGFGAGAGFVHVANPHISPGKKQWTWGNHAFGYAWDRHLSDDAGPYVELMAGVYTDNQPDFSFLHPGETRTWSQYWYPIQKIGPAQQANADAALSLRIADGSARVGVAVTAARVMRVRLTVAGTLVADEEARLSPGSPLVKVYPVPPGTRETDVRVAVTDAAGREVIAYQPMNKAPQEVPPPAKEPPLPPDVPSNEQLYLIGRHLEQYRHATRSAEDYWREAVRRDPADTRCHNALGLWHLRRGEFPQAAAHLRDAVAALTAYNPNPRDGEPYYNLALAERFLGEKDAAYSHFYKATWNYAWQSPAFFELARMDAARGDWPSALEHLERCLRVNTDHAQARHLKTITLRKLGRDHEAAALLAETRRLDPLDAMAQYLANAAAPRDPAMRLDLALDLAAAALHTEALALLESTAPDPQSGTAPLFGYYRGWLLEQRAQPGDADRARLAREQAAAASPDYCFPARLEELPILQSAIAAAPTDPRAPYYLGNWMYDLRRHEEAIALWEQSATLDPAFSIVWRNLGIGYYNHRHDADAAVEAYDRAFAANPGDARLLHERDQLWKRIGETAVTRRAELEVHPDLVRQRDDLTLEWCALLNQTGRPEIAARILQSRQFQPWEGGEGQALAQHVRAHLAMGNRFMKQGAPREALTHFRQALDTPENLGEAPHLLANRGDVHEALGRAYAALGDATASRQHYEAAAAGRGDFQEMAVRDFSEMTCFAARALRALARDAEADRLLQDLSAYAATLEKAPARIDYFATSLPTLLLFDDDLAARQSRQARVMAAQAHLGLGRPDLARTMLRAVLDEDPNNAAAADTLSEMHPETPRE